MILVTYSITAYQMVGIQVKELFMAVCQNCSVITIETTPTGEYIIYLPVYSMTHMKTRLLEFSLR